MRLIIKQRLIFVAVAIIVIAASVASVVGSYNNGISNQKERTRLIADVYIQRLNQDFQEAISITTTIEQVLIDGGGRIHHFDQIA